MWNRSYLLLFAFGLLLCCCGASLQWNASIPDETHGAATGYRIHRGTAPGVYDWQLDVGDTLTWTIPNDLYGSYYWTTSAYNLCCSPQPCTGVLCESGYSNEVFWQRAQPQYVGATDIRASKLQQQAEQPMAIERTGYASAGINPGTGNTGSFDITVPADTDCLIVYVTGYNATANQFTGSGASVTCEEAPADTVLTDADASSSYYAGAGWVFLNPPTGAGVTIAWDWVSTDTMDYAPMFCWVAYKGVGSIRSAYGDQDSAPPYETSSMTASSGDVVSVCVFGYKSLNAEASVTTWSNATEITEYTQYNVNYSDMTLAEHSPSGAVTIATTATADYEDGGIMAVIMIPSGGASALSINVADCVSPAIQVGN